MPYFFCKLTTTIYLHMTKSTFRPFSTKDLFGSSISKLLLLFALTILHACSDDPMGDETGEAPQAAFSCQIIPTNQQQVELKLTNNSINATRFEWVINQSTTTTDRDPVVILDEAAQYSITMTASNPWGSSTKEVTIAYAPSNGTPRIKDVSYSWWCDPISIYKNGINYFSGDNMQGEQLIYRFNQTTNELKAIVTNSGYRSDEHNSPSFIVRDNGAIITACTGHDESNIIKVQRIDESFVLTGTPKNIMFPGSTSYTQLFETNNRLFVTSRCISEWYIAWSDDEGATWTSPVIFMKKTSTTIPGAFYIRPIVIGNDRVAIGTYTHPVTAGDKIKLYYTEFIPSTGKIVAEDGSEMGGIYNGDAPAILENLDVVADAQPNTTFRFLDIATNFNGNTVFLIATSSTTDYSTGDYCLLERNHTLKETTKTTIVAHGNDLPHDTYWGGAYFVVDQNHNWNKQIYLARENASTWYVEKYIESNNQVSFSELLEQYASTDKRTLSRPLPPIGSTNGGLSVIYQKGEYYDYPSYMYWRNMELIMVKSAQITTSIPTVSINQ
jgi:PKD repeat protein